jgi:tetratricopeptide (TPR) repeat protein
MSTTGSPARELRLLFTPLQDGSFTVRLEDGSRRTVGVAATVTPFLDEGDFENLRWYLEDYMDLPDGGAVVRAERVERQLQDWGRRLHDAVFGAPENSGLLEALLAAPEPRELTIATDQSALLRLPWELMRDDAGNLAQRVAVRRQLETPESLVARDVELPLRMLYVVSRPGDAGFIDPRHTTRAVVAALDPLEGNVRLDFCRPPTLPQMEAMLREAVTAGDPYDVVHFDGHGTFLPEMQLGALCFEKPDDGSGESKTDLARADRLGDLLAQYKIPLVVLEACRSAAMGKTAVFRSVAPRLIQAGVGSVLSMSHAVHVEAAKLLLDRFYRELTAGATIGHAVAQARGALIGAPDRWTEIGPGGHSISLQDWFLPHLYQRGLDEALLPRDAANRPAVRQFDVFLSHNHNDSARVETLARTLSEKHGLRVWLDKWECKPGKLEPQCETGIGASRFTVVAGSQAALNSKWVAWEIRKHSELNPHGDRLLPVKFEPVRLPAELSELLWVDFTDPSKDSESAALLARHIRSADADDARRKRGFREPPGHGEPGAFPRPPRFGFQGRAKELYELEGIIRRHRGIVLHAMGGMGKTALATEAAQWWTRSGLFRDGACFVSFEQFASADRVIAVLGEYCEGPKFHQRPATEQRRRVVEFFRERAVLFVWDNYESVLPQFHDAAAQQGSPYTDQERRHLADLFHDLTIGPGQGCVLVTCRPGETCLPRARTFELHGLARADSLWLLHRILERDGVKLSDSRLSRDKLDPLSRDLADHPLSLELIGPHLRNLTPEQIRADFGKLVETMKQESDEGRNTSLLASLEFSRRHLSAAARAALPWLGLFSGGVFEDNFLDVSQIEPAAWDAIRAELAGIALLRTEDEIQIGGRPFLRFHPTLAIASADPALAAKPETRKRYLRVYLALMQGLGKALTGSQSRTALAILDREEMNYRTAVRWAIATGRHLVAAALGDTFRDYLERSGRLRERDAWLQMLRDAVTQVGFTNEAAAYERQHAWTLFTQGNPQGAIDKLRGLIERLHQTTEFDPAFQLAGAVGDLGRVLGNAGVSAQAIPVLREAIELWEKLVERAGGQPWERLLKTADHAKAATELRNLAAAMGDLSNALLHAGQHDEALRIAEDALTIDERRADRRNLAAGHGQCAQILMAAGRYDEADARYDRALAAARKAGDKELEGGCLQNQGILALERNQLDRATHLCQQALQNFQDAGDQRNMMRTYNLLGEVERKAGRLAEARAWYQKSRELAIELKAQPGLADAAQNIGIVWQQEGEAARDRGDEPAARRHFEEAIRSVEESLRIQRASENKPGEANSLSELARTHLLVGNLAAAERHAHESRQIREFLGHKEVFKDYNTLSEIAAARRDTAGAAEWARKRDELFAELERRAGGSGRIPSGMLNALAQLTVACARAGFGDDSLGPGEEDALANLDGFPGPFPAFAAHLRRLAAGELAPIPAGLPKELREILEEIHKAVRESG